MIIMDEKGFIFTADASLALVVVIVFMVTVVSYTMLPVYMGQDHQHLEALADSALQTMEQDGTLRQASIMAVNNSPTADSDAANFLNESLKTLIPNGIGYRITMNPGNAVSADNVGAPGTPLYSTNIVTRVRVISGPEEGWWGRAWYRSEPIEFTNKKINLTTTAWMFHNWLTNFPTWSGTGLRTNLYWGGGSKPTNITFPIPSNATLLNASFIQGSASQRRYSGYTPQAFGTNTVVNGRPAIVTNPNNFTFLNQRLDTNPIQRMFNYQGNIPISYLTTGDNNFHVQFLTDNKFNYDMPWFSILTTYTTDITVPVNVENQTIPFQNAAGLAVNRAVDLGAGTGYGRIYDLETGQVSNLNTRRTISWADMKGCDHQYSNGIPFVITNIPGAASGSAVCVEQNFSVPSTSNILDAYVVVNSWGATDKTLVEVWSNDTSTWRTVFNSFDLDGKDYSDKSDGYGNLPGIIYIGNELRQGATNKVRITTWDDVPSSDYDLVGLQDCFTVLFTSDFKIKWDTYPYNSHQASGNTEIQDQTFILTNESQKAMLFLATGLNTRNIRVTYADTGQELYNGPATFSIDLASIDAQKKYYKITTEGSTATDYTLVPGTYKLRVTVTGPRYAWESGDDNYNSRAYGIASIFSGTRIVVINPQVQNEWSDGMGPNPQMAIQNATWQLNESYKRSHNGNPIPPTIPIYTSALYTGNTPNSVPIRLELWKE